MSYIEAKLKRKRVGGKEGRKTGVIDLYKGK